MLPLLPSALSADPSPAQFSLRRPPSVPLVAHDPYLSIWSNADLATGGVTRHWTGKPQPLTSLVRVDGRAYRILGAAGTGAAPAMAQTGLRVTPTRTEYAFSGGGVSVALTFTTPALPDDLDVLSRPATYLSWRAASEDGRAHRVSFYFDAGALLAANEPGQTVEGRRERIGSLTALSAGTVDQPVLGKRGDDLRIDWGRVYVAAGAGAPGAVGRVGEGAASAAAFAAGRPLGRDEARAARPAGERPLALAFEMPAGSVGTRAVERRLTLAYDDGYSIELMGQRLRPYWRRPQSGGRAMDAAGLLTAAERDYPRLAARCAAFDGEMETDLGLAGGRDYAWLGALAYRQSLAAQKLVADANGQPLLFPKENDSNGCVSTVDVIYPASPLTLLLSPTLTKASLVPVLEYASSPRWKWPFAPHDVGTYPKANGQVYGGGERTEEDQMPVEESADMILVLAALAKSEGNARFCDRYWPTIARWARYLESKGFDPESQLSTDDFAGHLAHNVNLSAKAIEGLGAYATLARMRGETAEAGRVRGVAEGFARRWVAEAKEAEATRLAFDKPGTWSQKYNLVWDRVLGLDLFSPEVARRELALYRAKTNRYGVPLDSRRGYTKLDWSVWSATMGSPEDFDEIVRRECDFLSATSDRVPMSDWHETESVRRSGFKARSVVGGVFMKLLADPAVWGKWVRRDANLARGWAPLPERPVLREVVPTGRATPAIWSYTTTAPAADWTSRAYDASGWKRGPSVFGTPGTPGAEVRTLWDTSDIWLRREIEIPAGLAAPKFYVLHDEDVEIYVDGTLAARNGGFTSEYEVLEPLPGRGRLLTPGRHLVAVHCHQTVGGQSIDVGIGELAAPPRGR